MSEMLKFYCIVVKHVTASEVRQHSMVGENAKVRQEGVEQRAGNLRRKEIKTRTKRVLSDPIYSKIPNDVVQIEARVASDIRYVE
jgi:hypothetical protein